MTDRKTHWEAVYSGKSPSEVSWYQREPTLSLHLIRATGLGTDAAVIDVGGGASTLIDSLLAQGWQSLTVLDVSPRALERARARLGPGADSVTWIEADITGFTPPRRFDLWHDRAVFHFLTEKSDRDKYAACLRAALNPGAQAIIMTFAVGGPKKCSGLDIVQYGAEGLLRELGAGFVLLGHGHETHLTPADNEQAFAWFRLGLRPV